MKCYSAITICKNGDVLSKVLRFTEVPPTNIFKTVLLVRLAVSAATFPNVLLVISSHSDKSSTLNCGTDSIILIISSSVNRELRHSSIFKLRASHKSMFRTNGKEFSTNTSKLGRVTIASMPAFLTK